MFEIRTDLAVEEKESFPGDGGEVTGVSLREWSKANSKIKPTEVAILDAHGARAMGKPKGTYVTMEVAGELAMQLKKMVKELKRQKRVADKTNIHVLVVGLGNPSVTPDSLGPQVLGNLKVNRNMDEGEDVVLSGIVPGVMAQTGMETAEILRGIIVCVI